MRSDCKRGCLIVMAGTMLFCSGCKNHQGEKQEERMLQASIETSDHLQKTAAVKEVRWSEEEFKAFFEDYFSFNDKELMMLNQNRALTDELYWEQLNEYYGPLIEEKIGKYLTDELREQIKHNYRKEEIDLPRWMLLNEYIVSGGGKVVQIDLQNTIVQNDRTAYKVEVITTHAIFPTDRFNEQYKWEEAAGYFMEKDKTFQMQSHEVDYFTDEMKIQQSFWITVDNSKGEFKICRINNNALWKVMNEEKQSLLNTQHVKRIPYYEKVSDKEMEILKRLLTVLFQKDIQAYKYYESAYNSGYKLFEKIWEEWELEEIIRADAQSYELDFSKNISPYKDQVKYLKADLDNMVIQPSVYSTLRHPCFIISVPVQTLLYNNQIVYYNYKYFVGMEQNKVEFIQFMSIK